MREPLPFSASPREPAGLGANPSVESPGRSRFGLAGVIALLGGAQALILVAGLARWKVIALVLGPSGVAIAGVVDQAAQLVVQLGALNIPTAALRFLAIERDERGAAGFAWLYRTLLKTALLTTTAAAAVGVMIYLRWPVAFGAGMSAYAGAVIFGLAATPATVAVNLTRNVLATIHRHRDAALTLLASSILLAIGTYAGLRSGALRGAYLAALIVGVATAATLHLRVIPSLRARASERPGSLRALLRAHPDIVRFSMTLYAVGFAVPLGYATVRWTVLGRLGIQDAAFLAAAYTVAAGVRQVFSQASMQYLIPLTSRNLSKDTRAAEVAKYVRTLLLLVLVGVLPLLLFPRELLLVLYSRAFASATGVLGIFILAEVVMAIGDAYRALQLGFGDLQGYFVTTCAGPLLIVGGLYWVVPRFGLRGVALLQVAAAIVVLAWSIDRIRSRHGVRIDRRALAMTIYSLVALGSAVVVGRYWSGTSVGLIALKGGFGLGLVAAAAATLPLGERKALLRTLRVKR